MTRAENEAKLAELKSKAEELVKEYNEAIQTGKFEDASKTDEALTQTINEYRRERCVRTGSLPVFRSANRGRTG